MHIYHELSKVLKALQKEGIAVIMLKGAYLAEAVYDHVGLRPMSDVDILVKETDLLKVEKKLLEINYAHVKNSGIWGNAGIVEKCFTYVRNTGNMRLHIEVHWHIDSPRSPFKIDIDGLWKRAQPTMIAGAEVFVFSPEDLILHLCLHSTYAHFFQHKLRPFCDLFETIRHYQEKIDWTQVQYRARQWNCNNCVYLTLRLARDLLAAAVPDELLHALKSNDFDERLIDWAKEHILDDGNNTTPVSSPPLNLTPLERIKTLFFMFYGKGFVNRTICLFVEIFPSPKMMAQMYRIPQNSMRVYLYYPIRLKYLFLKIKNIFLTYSHDAWQLSRHDEEMMKLEKTRTLMKWLEQA